MNSGEEYLKRTESAVTKIFEGINSYIQILRNSKPPIYLGNAGDTFNQRHAHKKWIDANQAEIDASFKAQEEFSAENFALATLCGSLLQIAAMGIQWFSKNEKIPEDLPNCLYSKLKPKNKITKFCIGRRIRSLPIGLVIYAGRNQFNHMDDEKLKEPNRTIFNILAHNYADTKNQFSKDPAFDLKNDTLINFAANIVGLLEWKEYESYSSDMYLLIVARESAL